MRTSQKFDSSEIKAQAIYVLQVICLAVIYHLAARLGLRMAYVQMNTSPVWPPTGIALASLLIFGYRLWPGISLGVLAGSLFTGADFGVALGMAVGNTLEALADPVRDIEYSTVVTAMCRNGVEFGIRVSGLGDQWFTAPAPVVDGLYMPGYTAEDAGLDMGDSAITETVGWGGFVIGGAPGILSLVGGTPEEALNIPGK